MSEITRLCKAVIAAYQGEAAHLPKVREAITRLDGLKGRLKTPLDDALDKALSENDTARRAQYAKAAKDSLKSIRAFIEKDELMQNLDGNEILADMRVVQPMKDRLVAIEEALG
jgi:predicted P-loop ATPase